jgi:hypothetical protein
MSSAIVFPKDFKTSCLTISPLKVMDSGAKQAYINYDTRPLMMQVSAMSIPYGMSVFDKAGPKKYSVDLSLKGYDTDGSKMKVIYDAFASLDEYMIEQGVKNSKNWFKSDLNREVIKAFYTPIVRFSKDAEGNPKPYPPTVKIQLKQRDDKFETAIYDEKKRPLTDIPLEDILVKGATISSLIQCTGVWFAGSKYGLSWKAVQIKADHLPESIRGFAFRDEEDGTEMAKPEASKKPSSNHFSTLAEDDEVDDNETLVAPPPSAPPSVSAPSKVISEEPSDEDDVIEPVEVPKKPSVITKKKIVSNIKK